MRLIFILLLFVLGVVSIPSFAQDDSQVINDTLCALNPGDPRYCAKSQDQQQEDDLREICATIPNSALCRGITKDQSIDADEALIKTCADIPDNAICQSINKQSPALASYCKDNPSKLICLNVDTSNVDEEEAKRQAKEKDRICSINPSNPICSADENSILENAEQAGAQGVVLGFQYLNDMVSSCLPCSFVEQVIKVMYELGDNVTGIFTDGARLLLGMLFTVYILYQVGKLLFPFGPLDNVRKINGLITSHIGIAMVSGLLLTSFVNYWNIIFIPPATAGMDYVGSLLEVAREEMRDVAADNNFDANAGIYDPAASDRCTFEESPDRTDESQPLIEAEELGANVRCMMEEMQAALGLGVATGLQAMFSVWQVDSTGLSAVLSKAVRLPAMVIAFISGIVLIIVYGPTYLSFPIKVVDVVMRWALLAVISPFLIVFFAFPSSRYIALAAIRGMFQSIMELVMMGLVISLGGFVIVSIASGVDAQNTGILANSVLFWRFFFAGLIITMMVGKAKTFALALAYPRPNPKGMDVDVADGAAQSLEGALQKAGGGVNQGAVNAGGKGVNALGKGMMDKIMNK